MTNTTTGGGNGAAPATTEGTAPAPERLLPTRPGWWWRETTNGARISEVVDGYGGLVAASGCPVADASGKWLAPIPGPAVLAALAEYGEALLALDELNVRELRGAFGVLDSACAKLHDAIRAERDAERDGGA